MTDAIKKSIIDDDDSPVVSEPLNDPDSFGGSRFTSSTGPSLHASSATLSSPSTTPSATPAENDADSTVPLWTVHHFRDGVLLPTESSQTSESSLPASENASNEPLPPLSKKVEEGPPTTSQEPPRISRIPWWAGPQHCVDWPARSPNSGYLSLASGLVTQSLREPGAAGYIDPAVTPKNEGEWEALYSTSFDDLAVGVASFIKSQPPSVTEPVTWKQRFLERVELEKRIFGNTDVYSFMRVAPAFKAETRFHCRWTGPLYSVGTAVTRSFDNEAIYDEIAKDSRAREMQTFASELKLRIAEANTVTKAEELLGSIVKALESFEESKDTDSIENTKLLKALCEERLRSLKEDEAAVVGEKEVIDAVIETDDDEDDPKPTEEDDPTPTDPTPPEPKPTEEVRGLSLLEQIDAARKAQEQGTVEPVPETKGEEPDESFPVTESDGKKIKASVQTPSVVPESVEFDPTTMSQEALNAKLEKMPRPVHIVSTITLPLDEEGMFPFEVVADPKTAPPVHTVFAHQLDYKGRGPFEQITDKTLQGTIWTLSMHPTSQGSCKWRALKKVRVQIPCSFHGYGQELLVVDHDKAYVIMMPKGSATKEVFQLRRQGAQRTQFKISHCHMTKDHVCLAGFTANNTRPLVLVYHRRKGLCTAYQTSIPVTSAILSEDQPGTLLLGFKDGTVLRLAIPTNVSRKSRPNFVIYHPVADDHDNTALLKLRKARGDYKIEEATVPQDWVVHVGAPLPVTRLVEHRRRLIGLTSMGLHLFRFYLPESDDDRRVTMCLRNVVSYEWIGNVLVTLSQDNSLRMLQLHECRLEVTMGAPIGLSPKPPECTMDCAAISMSDQAIIIVHMDGSRRILELKDSVEVVAALAKKKDGDLKTEEDKAKSFLPGEATVKPPPRVVKKRFVRTVKK